MTNPATGVVEQEFPTMADSDVPAVIDRADREHTRWRDRPVEERAAALRRAADLFDQRSDELAALVMREMGKRPAEGKGELWLTARIFRYYAENGAAMIADETLEVEGAAAVIEKRSIGVVLGIMPWNYPYYQVARFAAANLILGNTILLKHAPSCPASSAAIERLLHDAGVPADAYINVYASNEQVAEIIADPRVHGVSLTGSERAGAAVAAIAGAHLTKVVLELGGSDPLIVLDTADVKATAAMAVAARMGNSGQACNAPKRMIVMADLYDAFVEEVAAQTAALVLGDPADEATTLAPLSSTQAAETLMAQLERAVEEGAVVRTGGRRLDRPGAWVEATVLTDIRPGTEAYEQELFGPVAIVFRVEDEAEAVRLANDTPFGLGAAVFSSDVERARRVGRQLDVGMVYINATEGSQADLPFGGVKRSGIGRELGQLGVEEFMNKRIVRI
ncbi:NAD-dependent succinate-semialdehyde dehydrogenase [Dactylosporangium sp. NPDC051485]|uniref:NAD-dependent succinate-semialdehyde dehydrogenase n=1 Tax=Dactylosporangium sp. NPDC051485 TaxID=3154846 RepID=UPI00341720A7